MVGTLTDGPRALSTTRILLSNQQIRGGRTALYPPSLADESYFFVRHAGGTNGFGVHTTK
jgi:hypothetical protein